MSEELYPIKGYEGLYSITKQGEVYSHTIRHGIGNKFLKGVDWLGYKKVQLWKHGKSKWYKVHRLVAEAFILNPENKPCVNHIDGDPSNNSMFNLEWCTHKENTQHAWRIGLKSSTNGTHGYNRKITETQREEIMHLLYWGIPQQEIAGKYNVCRQTITNTKRRYLRGV